MAMDNFVTLVQIKVVFKCIFCNNTLRTHIFRRRESSNLNGLFNFKDIIHNLQRSASVWDEQSIFSLSLPHHIGAVFTADAVERQSWKGNVLEDVLHRRESEFLLGHNVISTDVLQLFLEILNILSISNHVYLCLRQ